MLIPIPLEIRVILNALNKPYEKKSIMIPDS